MGQVSMMLILDVRSNFLYSGWISLFSQFWVKNKNIAHQAQNWYIYNQFQFCWIHTGESIFGNKSKKYNTSGSKILKYMHVISGSIVKLEGGQPLTKYWVYRVCVCNCRLYSISINVFSVVNFVETFPENSC